jgi:hypothetical protein
MKDMLPIRKETDNKIIGIGGLHCSCCAPLGVRKTKVASRRRLRHAVKAAIREGTDE